MAECWTAGVKAGIDAATIVKVFQRSRPRTDDESQGAPAGGLFARRLRTALLVRIGAQGSGAQELARATDTPMPLGAFAARLRGDPEQSSARDTSLIDVNCVAAQIGTEGIRFVEPIPAPAANLVISIVEELHRNIV